jgi:hypothetical protein
MDIKNVASNHMKLRKNGKKIVMTIVIFTPDNRIDRRVCLALYN